MFSSVRKQLILKLLEENTWTVRQIADKANCSAGYVYNIRADWLKNKTKNNFTAHFRELDWSPSWLEITLMAILAGVTIYFLLIFIFSF